MTPPQEAPGASHQGTATSPPSPDGGSRSRRTGCPQGTSPNPSQTGAKPPGITGGGSPNCPTGRTGTVRGVLPRRGSSEKASVPAAGGQSRPWGARHGGRGGHGPQRGTPVPVGRAGSSTLPGSARWQCGGQEEPHRLRAPSTGSVGDEAGAHAAVAEGRWWPRRGTRGGRGQPSRAQVGQQMPPLAIISNSFLIYLNKQAVCLPQLEVFEQPKRG